MKKIDISQIVVKNLTIFDENTFEVDVEIDNIIKVFLQLPNNGDCIHSVDYDLCNIEFINEDKLLQNFSERFIHDFKECNNSEKVIKIAIKILEDSHSSFYFSFYKMFGFPPKDEYMLSDFNNEDENILDEDYNYIISEPYIMSIDIENNTYSFAKKSNLSNYYHQYLLSQLNNDEEEECMSIFIKAINKLEK